MSITAIYKITSPTNRIYIGQAVDIEKRWRDYLNMNSKTKQQVKLWRSFLKHGVENHTFEIIEECIREDLNCRERYWQDFYDVLNGGLNCELVECGNNNRIIADYRKDLIRIANLGRVVSAEVRAKIGLASRGNSWNIGRVRPQEEKDKISKTMKEKGINVGEMNPMFGKTGENNPGSKIILCQNTGIFYYGVREAAFALSIPYSSLKKMISGGNPNKTSLIYV